MKVVLKIIFNVLDAARGGVDGVPRTLSNNISLVQIDLFTQKGKFYFFKNVSSELLVFFQKYFIDFFNSIKIMFYFFRKL